MSLKCLAVLKSFEILFFFFWLYTTMLTNINGEANYTIPEIKQIYRDSYGKLFNLVTAPLGRLALHYNAGKHQWQGKLHHQ